MLEIDLIREINETFDWNVLAGIGQTTFDFGANSATIPRAAAVVGSATDNSDTAMRFGAGVSFDLSDSTTLLTMLQLTNYGSADLAIGAGADQTTTSVDG